jgi:hypothetical protein
MEKQNGTIEFTGKNFKIVNLEFSGNEVFFNILIGDKGAFGKGDLTFNCTVECSEFVYDNCDLMLDKFQWDHNMELFFMNNRNTKLICDAIESIINEDPESFGFDMQEYENDQLNWNAELNYQINRESCY